jgi:hypothetical protein
MKKLLTTVMVGVLVTGCAGLSKEQSEFFGTTLGGLGGGIVGTRLDTKFGTGGLATTALTGIGAAIGGEIAKYLTPQDKENIAEVLADTSKSQPVAWCSNSRSFSRNVNNVQCNGNKIIETPGVAVNNEKGEFCRVAKTEVLKTDGRIETVTQNLCRAKTGEWYDKNA